MSANPSNDSMTLHHALQAKKQSSLFTAYNSKAPPYLTIVTKFTNHQGWLTELFQIFSSYLHNHISLFILRHNLSGGSVVQGFRLCRALAVVVPHHLRVRHRGQLIYREILHDQCQ
jgi:hypothetical protein